METTEIELFRPGTFTAMTGQRMNFTSETLKKIADGYDPAVYDAPVVVGHPETNAPAYGWVKGLRMDGDRLKATVHNIDPAFAELVKAGKYRKVSASFYMPDHTNNPTPGKLSLRHVGFLGAQPPAVKGLKPVQFAEGDRLDRVAVVDVERAPTEANFSEEPTTVEELRQQVRALTGLVHDLRAQNADFAQSEQVTKSRQNRAFIEGLIGEGRFIPGHAEQMIAFMDALDASGGTVQFSEDGETVERGGADFLRQYLKSQPVQVHFAEFSAPDAAAMGEEPSEDEVAERIDEWVQNQRAQGRAVSYSDGLRAISLSRNA